VITGRHGTAHPVALLALAALLAACDDPQGPRNASTGCPGATYAEWSTSAYVLPYPVGSTFTVGLSNCSGSFHSAGQPDAFAVDFDMPIGSPITAARPGTVVHVVESGRDFDFPNNLVVVDHGDGTFAQYMHLTLGGADVAVGAPVDRGDALGRSGATGLAGYPHLHFVVTAGSWAYPYTSVPVNFRNTAPNPRGPAAGESYTAGAY
jgi:murein DD-endopeptidase MepM/ murein hydrolase activator NlpD